MAGKRIRTQVGVIGAGPAGLVLANVLLRAGIDVHVVERHPREQVEQRARAGLVEHRTVEYLRAHGLADRLLADGTPHGWCVFHCLGQRVRVDYAANSGGARHWIYPQQLLVRDLIAALERAGRAPHFARPALSVSAAAGEGPARITCPGLVLDCDAVAGCDGWHGVSRAALPASVRREVALRYPYDWLTVLAETDGPVPGVRYAVHEQGFAGMMPRTRDRGRLYLQVPPGDLAEDWPEDRLRKDLRCRLLDGGADADGNDAAAASAAAALPRVGAVLETGVLRMRGMVTSPMRHGRLFLAGDAAHVLTPSGAKGMNLAIADAADLANGLVRHLRDKDPVPLEGYAERRLREAWRTQEFSDWLLGLLHLPNDHRAGAGGDADPEFALRLRLARIRRLAEPGPQAAAFAHAYAGAAATVTGRITP